MENKINSMPDDRAIVDFFTGSHRLSAAVMTYKRRLVDVLGDRMTDYLELADVYVSRIDEPGHIIATYQQGSLIKDKINFILLPSETYTVSKGRSYNPGQARMSVFVTTRFFEIQGEFQWLKEFNITKIMATDTEKFLPVFNGSATNAFSPQVSFQSPAILINKSKIEVLCVDSANESISDLIKPVAKHLGSAKLPV